MGRGDFTAGQVEAQLGPLLGFIREVPVEAACREKASFYYARRSPYGLSLGNAACLGTAEALKMEMLTAERGWAGIPDVPVEVRLIR